MKCYERDMYPVETAENGKALLGYDRRFMKTVFYTV
jgi:hypothetical protein